jgi:ABC-type xylose transport system substrate-binding protein
MNRFGKVLLSTLAVALLVGTGLFAQKTVGIAMPTQSSARWIKDDHIVPSYLCDPVSVDITNIKPALIDTGYYTATSRSPSPGRRRSIYWPKSAFTRTLTPVSSPVRRP